jgi:hypothetical protein
MTPTITYDSRDNIIEVKVQGDLTLQRVKEIASEIMKISKEQNCFLLLTDLREATVKLSTLEIYELPKTLSEIAASYGLGIYQFKRVFVAPKGQDNLTFFDNVSFNSAQNAKYFFDVDEARSWLLEK